MQIMNLKPLQKRIRITNMNPKLLHSNLYSNPLAMGVIYKKGTKSQTEYLEKKKLEAQI